MKKKDNGSKTLLTSILMSAPGPLIIGLGLMGLGLIFTGLFKEFIKFELIEFPDCTEIGLIGALFVPYC